MSGRPPRRPGGGGKTYTVPDGGRYDSRAGSGAAASVVPVPVRPHVPDRLLRRPLVEARTSLCDALDAMADHQEGLVVVGSQAVHERTKSLKIVSTTTKDCDLAVVPSLVGTDPNIEELMRAAGFAPLRELPGCPSRFEHQPGVWGKGFAANGEPVVEVDLIVPETLAGKKSSRSAPSMLAHGKMTTRRTEGIDLVVADRDLMPIVSFADGSAREAYVAGPAALLCAKAYKVGERVAARDAGGKDRVAPKDCSDMWRLMAASDPAQVAQTFDRLRADDTVGHVAVTGLAHLRTLTDSGELVDLAEDDLRGAVTSDHVRTTHDRWTAAFFAALDRS